MCKPRPSSQVASLRGSEFAKGMGGEGLKRKGSLDESENLSELLGVIPPSFAASGVVVRGGKGERGELEEEERISNRDHEALSERKDKGSDRTQAEAQDKVDIVTLSNVRSWLEQVLVQF